MFKKFTYLASTSLIVMMVMEPSARAMEDEDQATVYNRATKEAQSNALYFGEDGDPRIGAGKRILKDTFIHLERNITGKINKILSIRQQIQSGNYDELAAETVAFFIASLAGEGQKELYNEPQKEISTEVLVKASRTLTNQFFFYLSKNNDLYGQLADGTHVTIYNRSLFKMFAEKYFPEVPVLTKVTIAVLDKAPLKNFIQDKVLEAVFNHLKKSLESQGITLKDKLGQETVKIINSALYDESSIDYAELWKYLSPHLTYQLRNYMLPQLKTAKNIMMKKWESDLWYATVPTAAFASATAAPLIGSILYTAGAYLANPYVDVGLWPRVVGSILDSFLGTSLTFVGGGMFTHSGVHATKNYLNQQMDNKIDSIIHRLIPLSPEEHALYGLNPLPNPIERGLAYEDYQLRDTLNSRSFIRSVLESVSESSGINALMSYIFGAPNTSPVFQLPYCPFEEQEQAYRQLTLLKKTHPEQAEGIIRNISKYPSFEQRLKFLQHLETVSLQEVAEQEKQAKQYSASRQAIVKKIQNVANALTQQLIEHNQEIASLTEDLSKAFVKEILASSIESQDYIIKWAENNPEKLGKVIKDFAAQHKFFNDNLLSFDDEGNVEVPAPSLNEQTVQEFVTNLTNTYVQEYMDNLNEDYKKKHPDALNQLLRNPVRSKM